MQLNTQSKAYPWICWGIAAAIYFLQYGLLMFPTAITQELYQDLGIGPTHVSIFSSAFLYTYAAMQIPVGLLFDRFGSRRLLTYAAILIALGCFMLAFSPSFGWAFAARLLMGLGASFTFIGAIYLGRVWFPVMMFPIIVGVTEAMSGLGEISLPVIFTGLKHILTWRLLMFYIGLLIIILAIAAYIFIRDSDTVISEKSSDHIWADLKAAVHNPYVWLLGLYSGFAFAHFTVLADMWTVPFIKMVHQISTFKAIMENSFSIFGFTLGCLTVGYLARVMSERMIILLCAIVVVLGRNYMMYFHITYVMGCILLFVIGLGTSSAIVPFNIAKRYVASASYGAASGFINMIFAGLGMLVTPLVGYILKVSNYNINYAVIPITVTTVLALFCAVIIYRRENLARKQARQPLR